MTTTIHTQLRTRDPHQTVGGRRGHIRRFSAVAAGGMLVFTLAGCASDDVTPAAPDDSASVADQSLAPTSTSTTSSKSARSNLPSEETLKTYFEGIAAGTIAGAEEAMDAAAPGSMALAYANYLRGNIQAMIDGGIAPPPEQPEVKKVDGGFEYCYTGSQAQCYTNTKITGKSDKVANFSVNDKPLKGRLYTGDDKPITASGEDVQARFIAAYETTSDKDLIVVFSLKTGKTASLASVQGTYRSPEGRQSTATITNGPFKLGTDSLANYAMVFPNAALGGNVTVTMFDESFQKESTLTLRTR